jgi:hypothetical protein
MRWVNRCGGLVKEMRCECTRELRMCTSENVYNPAFFITKHVSSCITKHKCINKDVLIEYQPSDRE